jgi:hypothetical protein
MRTSCSVRFLRRAFRVSMLPQPPFLEGVTVGNPAPLCGLRGLEIPREYSAEVNRSPARGVGDVQQVLLTLALRADVTAVVWTFIDHGSERGRTPFAISAIDIECEPTGV